MYVGGCSAGAWSGRAAFTRTRKAVFCPPILLWGCGDRPTCSSVSLEALCKSVLRYSPPLSTPDSVQVIASGAQHTMPRVVVRCLGVSTVFDAFDQFGDYLM